MAGPIIGIDLGATYSCVGILRNEKVEIIPNDEGNRVTPSCVAFSGAGWLVGEAAERQAGMNPFNTISNMKRLIGRDFDDVLRPGTDDVDTTYRVANVDGRAAIEVEYKGQQQRLAPEEITAMVLHRLKLAAEAYLGVEVKDAVVSVPACFGSAQREATRNAGTIAGLNVLRIVSESTAAAIAYTRDRYINAIEETRVMVYDLGGGTFEATYFLIEDGIFETVTVAGDPNLGGDDLDRRLATHLADDFEQAHETSLDKNPLARCRLRRACEIAKRELSVSMETTIKLDALVDGMDFEASITRDKFEELCIDLFKHTLHLVETGLRQAKVDKSAIQEILLVGGSSRIPKVRKLLREFFDGKGLTTAVNLDEVVARGAAVQAAMLKDDASEELQWLLYLDVIPRTIALERSSPIAVSMIMRHTAIPAKQTQMFTTYADSACAISFPIYEGNAVFAKDNTLLGRYELTGIPPAPRGVPQIEVALNIDASGILHVSAIDRHERTGKMITVTNLHVPPNRLDKMVENFNRMNDAGAFERRKALAEETVVAVRSDPDTERARSLLERGREVVAWINTHPRATLVELVQQQQRLELACWALSETEPALSAPVQTDV
eukprot:m.163283 g.163283  ORF g.163283 m.163283 type:complete len:609 (-) comp14629_c0_seq2:150-1976(-)